VVEEMVISLLVSKVKNLDHTGLQCSLLFPALEVAELLPWLLNLGLESEIETVKQAYSGSSQCLGSVLWVPVMGQRGKIISLLRIERKFKGSFMLSAPDTFGCNFDKQTSSSSASDLSILEREKKLIEIFAR
jgi:hypothetical protein